MSGPPESEHSGEQLPFLPAGRERDRAYRALTPEQRKAHIAADLRRVEANAEAYAEDGQRKLARMESERRDRAACARQRRAAVADPERTPTLGVWHRRRDSGKAWRATHPADLSRRERGSAMIYRRQFALARTRRHVGSIMRPCSGRPRARQRRDGSRRNRTRGGDSPSGEPEPDGEPARRPDQHIEPARRSARLTFGVDPERRSEGRR